MVRTAVNQRGGETDAANHLHRWVSEHPMFTDVVYRSFFFPASPWFPSDHPDAAKLNRTGTFIRDDILVRRFLLDLSCSSDGVRNRYSYEVLDPCCQAVEWTKLSSMLLNRRWMKNFKRRRCPITSTSRTCMHVTASELNLLSWDSSIRVYGLTNSHINEALVGRTPVCSEGSRNITFVGFTGIRHRSVRCSCLDKE